MPRPMKVIDLQRKVETMEAVGHAQTIALALMLHLQPDLRQQLAAHIPKAMDLALGMSLTEDQLAKLEWCLRRIACVE